MTPYSSKVTFSDNVATAKTLGDEEEQEADDKHPPPAVEKNVQARVQEVMQWNSRRLLNVVQES